MLDVVLENIGNELRKLKMTQYWPEHRVFFIATLALFPGNLKDCIITEIFYRPYFPSDDIDYIGMLLEEYKKNDYIDYINDGEYAFKFTSFNTKKAKEDLVKYLKQWGQNKLHTPAASKPSDSTYQQDLLVKAITVARTRNKTEPRVNLEDVYGKTTELAFEPSFWELVLYNHFISKKVEVTFIGYDRSFSGLYNKKTQPFVDLVIKDEKLLKATSGNQLVTQAVGITQPITTRSYDIALGKLFFANKMIEIIRQESRRGKAVGETGQGRAMRLLFKDVNTLKNGVDLHRVTSVRKDKFDSKKRKLAINHLTEINRKVHEETGVEKLINFSQTKYYIDKSYLE